MTEAKIQSEFFKWVWNTYPAYRFLLYHIPNGGYRNKIEANRLKASGVVAGIPDMHFAFPSKGYNSLYIEFKEPGTLKDGQVLKNDAHHQRQAKAQLALSSAGNKVVLCDSLPHAKQIFLEYIQ